MEEHVDVAARDAERARHVFAVALFEHAERDDRALRVAQARDAGAEPHVIFGAREGVVEPSGVDGLVVLEWNVRARDVVLAAFVSRGVLHDAREERAVRRFDRQVPGDRALEKRAECILYAIDRVFLAEPFATRERREPTAFGADDRGEQGDRVFHVRSVRFRSLATRKVMSQIVSVTDATFDEEVLAARGDVLVEFSATWCKPCQMLKPVLESIAKEREGSVKVVVIDIDESPNVSNRYKVRGAPTLMVFRGGERAASHLGVAPKAKLLALLSA